MSVDGTDFRVSEPKPFNKKWFSFKFRGAGLRYEIGICIRRGRIVWTHGPFPAGPHTDLKIFRAALRKVLRQNEKVVADDGYPDSKCIRKGLYVKGREKKNYHHLIRARHETCNRRLKQFGVLGSKFRHPLRKHGMCFRAVVCLTDLSLRFGSPLFNVF